MIITRTPFRISFAGGGSDLPSFYTRHEGCVLSASINKYMYVIVHPSFDKSETIVKYRKMEIVKDLGELQHPIARQILQDYNLSGVEIASISDIPAGTGLASSSAYTVGAINAVSTYVGKIRSNERLAKEACEVEIEKLGETIGKQDQYGVAVGGLKFIRFMKDGNVQVTPILLPRETLHTLNDNLMMFYTGNVHSASAILKEQSANTSQDAKFNNLVKMTELAYELRDALTANDLTSFGQILHQGWMLKRELASGITSPEIDYYYDLALQNGALGGKLLGAGGGGFLLFYAEKDKQKAVLDALSELMYVPFQFENGGSRVIYYAPEVYEMDGSARD